MITKPGGLPAPGKEYLPEPGDLLPFALSALAVAAVCVVRMLMITTENTNTYRFGSQHG